MTIVIYLPCVVIRVKGGIRALGNYVILTIIKNKLTLTTCMFASGLDATVVVFYVATKLVFITRPSVGVFVVVTNIIVTLTIVKIVFLGTAIDISKDKDFHLEQVVM